MKQIRRFVFETNSSSSHSFTLNTECKEKRGVGKDKVERLIKDNALDLRKFFISGDYATPLPKLVYLQQGLSYLIYNSLEEYYECREYKEGPTRAKDLCRYSACYQLLVSTLCSIFPNLKYFPFSLNPSFDFDCGGEKQFLEIFKSKESLEKFIFDPSIVLRFCNNAVLTNVVGYKIIKSEKIKLKVQPNETNQTICV